MYEYLSDILFGYAITHFAAIGAPLPFLPIFPLFIKNVNLLSQKLLFINYKSPFQFRRYMYNISPGAAW